MKKIVALFLSLLSPLWQSLSPSPTLTSQALALRKKRSKR